MKRDKIAIYSAVAVIGVLLLTAGCAEPVEEKQEMVALALKFAPQDSTTYRVTTESQQILEYEGSLKEKPGLKGGRNVNRLEMTFAQETESINDKGNIIAKIKIDDLKYKSIIRGETVVKFAGRAEKDSRSPLAKLIGKTYKIEIAPNGTFVRVVDVREAMDAVSGSSADHKRAQAFLRNDVIERRHSMIVLPEPDENLLTAGGTWSRAQTFSFPIMGQKSYERVYTVKEIQKQDDRQIAVVEMNAIPATGTSEQLQEEDKLTAFLDMFDSTQTYTGLLKVDLNNGKIEGYSEVFNSEWVFVDPSVIRDEARYKDKEPDSFRMIAIRSYGMEKIN